jgi:hypothetical protein
MTDSVTAKKCEFMLPLIKTTSSLGEESLLRDAERFFVRTSISPGENICVLLFRLFASRVAIVVERGFAPCRA